MDVDVLLVYALDGEGALVRDEVDVVPPLGELDAEPGGKYAASADAWVAGDSYPRRMVPLTLAGRKVE